MFLVIVGGNSLFKCSASSGGDGGRRQNFRGLCRSKDLDYKGRVDYKAWRDVSIKLYRNSLIYLTTD